MDATFMQQIQHCLTHIFARMQQNTKKQTLEKLFLLSAINNQDFGNCNIWWNRYSGSCLEQFR